MKKIILLIFIFSEGIAFSQEINSEKAAQLIQELPLMKADSTKVSSWNNLSIFYKKSNLQKSRQYAIEALKLAQKLNWKDGIGNSQCNLGLYYFQLGDFANALKYLNQVSQSTNNKIIKSKALHGIGLVYTYQNNYSKALDYSFQSLKISEEIKDKSGIASSMSTIGIIYADLSKFPKALEFFESGLKIHTELNNEANISQDLGNIGNIYSIMKQNEKAIQYYEKTLKINEKLHDSLNKTITLGTLANSHLNLKNYKTALDYGTKSLDLAYLIKNKSIISYTIELLGNIYTEMAIKQNNNPVLLEKAKVNFLKALDMHKEINSPREVSNDYKSLSDIFSLEKNDKKALEYYKNAMIYKDSVFNFENKETIKNLEDKRTIELRDEIIKINKLKLETKEKQKWFFILGLSLLAIIGGLLFYQSRNRKKTNQKLQLLNTELDKANKTKARFFSILNHDLRSPVSNLIHFLHLQKNNPELLDQETKTRMQNKTILGAENLLNSMEDILLWSKGQMENFKPLFKNVSVNNLFEDTKKYFESEENIKIIFDNSENIDLLTDENYLKTIMRNLTGNAIKPLLNKAIPNEVKGQIFWKAYKLENQNFLSITDNGSGASQEQFKALYDENEVVGIKTGLGLHLIRDLAKAINCEIIVDSKVGVGTTFTLKL